jgi:hypothetical protein
MRMTSFEASSKAATTTFVNMSKEAASMLGAYQRAQGSQCPCRSKQTPSILATPFLRVRMDSAGRNRILVIDSDSYQKEAWLAEESMDRGNSREWNKTKQLGKTVLAPEKSATS